MSDPQALSEKLSGALSALIAETRIARGELTITVEPGHLLSVLGWLQWQGEFKILVDLCGVDWPQRAKRFDVVYHLLSLTNNQRIRVKVMVGEGEAVASCARVYPAANWFEREAFDMYGVRFQGHPDLRRILMYPEFQGYPLRKDYPKEKRQPLLRRLPGSV